MEKSQLKKWGKALKETTPHNIQGGDAIIVQEHNASNCFVLNKIHFMEIRIEISFAAGENTFFHLLNFVLQQTL